MAEPTIDFDPNEYLKSKLGNPASTTPSPDPGIDPIQLQQFDPKAYLQDRGIKRTQDLQDQYGTGAEQTLAAIEGAARGASFGASDYGEQKLAQMLPESVGSNFSKEAIKKRQEANPATAFLSNTAGGALVGGPIVKGVRALGAGALAAEAALGAAFGLGGAISEASLGDHDLNAEKLLTHVGMGAALGTGFGVLGKTLKATPALVRGASEKLGFGAKSAEVAPEAAVESGAPAVPGTEPIVNVPEGGKKATSLDELKQQIENVKKYGGQGEINELPMKPEAVAAAQRLAPDMQIPITDMQVNSLNSQDARNLYKTMSEVPGDEGEILRNAHMAQKKNLTNLLGNTIDSLAPAREVTSNAAEAGSRAADAFTEVVENARRELGPAIKQIKETNIQNIDHLPGVLDYLTNPEASPRANPKIGNMFDTTSPGKIAIKPYNTGMGIDQTTYRAVKQMVNGLEENPKDFEKLFDVRKGLAQNIDLTKAGDASVELGKAKAAMMDYIQDTVNTLDPDQKVRDVFAKYARNEENANFIESKFGAEIGSGNFRSLAKGKAEESILKKIFSDSATTQAAKEILPPERFSEMLADYLAILKEDATDRGSFSANKFMSKIGKGTSRYAIDEAFTENPKAYGRIKDIITTMRAFTDDMPHNPSGTAKTILQALTSSFDHPTSVLGNLREVGMEHLSRYKLRSEINAQLAGTQAKNSQLKAVQTILKKVDTQINQGVKSIFKSDTLKAAALSASVQLSDHKFHEIAKLIGNVSTNPDAMLEHMASNTEDLNGIIPNTTQSMSTAAVRAFTFLSSKLPKPNQQYLLSNKWEPSQDQLSKFSKYYNAVNDPISTLKQVGNGTLSNETMEALQVVHPSTLADMQQKVMAELKPEKVKNFNYSKKLSLSKFIGLPLDGSMTPQAIQSNQASFNVPPAQPQPAPKKKRSNLGATKQLKISKLTATQTARNEEE